MRIAIMPVGPVDETILEGLRRSLSEIFPDTDAVVFGKPLPMPADAHNPRRGQHHSTRILSHIEAHPPAIEADRVLGVAEVDLYVPGLNFVFGEAVSHRGPAVISLFRLRSEFYGDPPNPGLYLERATKEAVHEVGHTLGLGHCRDPRCVMFFSNSILDTDRKGGAFCENCRSKVFETVKRLDKKGFRGHEEDGTDDRS